MQREKLLETLQRILKTDADLRFLLKLEEHEIETLIACIRERVDNL